MGFIALRKSRYYLAGGSYTSDEIRRRLADPGPQRYTVIKKGRQIEDVFQAAQEIKWRWTRHVVGLGHNRWAHSLMI